MQFNTPDPLQGMIGTDKGGIEFGTTAHRHPWSDFQRSPDHTPRVLQRPDEPIVLIVQIQHDMFGRPSEMMGDSGEGGTCRARWCWCGRRCRCRRASSSRWWCGQPTGPHPRRCHVPQQVRNVFVAEELLQDEGWYRRPSLRLRLLVLVSRRRRRRLLLLLLALVVLTLRFLLGRPQLWIQCIRWFVCHAGG